MAAFGSLLTAVDTNTRSPHTTGLDTASPAIGVFQITFSPVVTFHFTAVGCPSATPDAFGPRNEGQFWAASDAPAASQSGTSNSRRIGYLPSTRVQIVPLFGKLTETTLS